MVDGWLDELIGFENGKMPVSRHLIMEKVTIIMLTVMYHCIYLNMQPEVKPSKSSAREDLVIIGLNKLLLAI